MIQNSLSSIANASKGSPRISFPVAILILLGFTAAMFAGVLLSTEKIVLSIPHTDLFDQFAYWREFGFSQMRHGNLALWNPHVFSGAPFFGGLQSALLYPLNIVYLILPLAMAINVSVAMHVFLVGTFMYLWALHRGLHPLACLLSSVLLMFCGANFMQIQAGHLPHLCTMTWAPLVFLSIDGFFRKPMLRWCLLGMFAITMQIFAGYPQHLYFTAVTAALYSTLCMVKAKQRVRIFLGLLSMYAGASVLGAVQLLPAIQVAGESIRSGGLSYEFAARFSFPPENLITFFAPCFFGNETTIPYWGRWYLWEMFLFVGVTGLMLAVYGSFCGKRSIRRFSVAMVVTLIFLALGAYTPLFGILHGSIPGFDKFRGSSKFIFQASLFITMLAGIGFDHIARHGIIKRKTVVAILIVGMILGTAAVCIRNSAEEPNDTGWWRHAMYQVYDTSQSYLPQEHYRDPQFVRKAGFLASRSLMVGAGICVLLSFLLLLLGTSRKLPYVIAILAMAEIFVFARMSLSTFHLSSIRSPKIEKMLASHPGDYRIFNPKRPDAAMSMGVNDIWGYDSVVLKRYAEFMTFTQGNPPNEASQYVEFTRLHRLYKMLRCRFSFIPTKGKGGKVEVIESEDVMPRLQLIQDYAVMKDRDEIFDIMEGPSFDPRQKVILETHPQPEPVVSEKKGTASVIDSSSDHLTVEADLPGPAILLITDTYSDGWNARALPGSSQQEYVVMPANYILRAIPLSRGYHRIRIEYKPLTFQIGKWVSMGSFVSCMIFLGWHLRKKSIMGGHYRSFL
ncbi:MAG: hypothetical protein JRD47_07440 [Deltaproteobacteria bacterium]|nr:hypothetical protein [Deltaproteobacteria bacterium]